MKKVFTKPGKSRGVRDAMQMRTKIDTPPAGVLKGAYVANGVVRIPGRVVNRKVMAVTWPSGHVSVLRGGAKMVAELPAFDQRLLREAEAKRQDRRSRNIVAREVKLGIRGGKRHMQRRRRIMNGTETITF